MAKRIIWSYGGGTQSIAIALLIAQGRLPMPSRIIFADTGREATETFEYTSQYIAPLLATMNLKIEIASHDIANVDLYKIDKETKEETLLIPAFTRNGKLPTFCSSEWKTRVVRRYIGGYEANRDGIIMWLGMSTDEIERLKPSDVQWIENHWPLCNLSQKSGRAGYNIRMNRAECKQLILDHGWPEPPKSSCWMCPHRRNPQWQRLKMFYPADFAKAVHLDKETRAKDTMGGVWLHESHKPLDEIDFTKEDQPALFGCDSGSCWT